MTGISDFSILAPVPLEHLQSGRAIASATGFVAFGSRKWELFRKVDELRGGARVPVLIYPSHEDFERSGRRITIAVEASQDGSYADERVMRRPCDGSLFWCHVSGYALDRARPHAAGIWSLEDISASRPVAVELTPREREIGVLLVEGLTSKVVAKRLGLSYRTVEIYRSRLMRKHGVDTATGLVRKLMGDALAGPAS